MANPADPWHRVLNYPRVWQLAARLGLAQRHTVLVSLVMIAVFVLGLVLLVDRIDRTAALLMAAAIFSPAVMLGIERANICLLIFFLCAGALFALRRSPPAAAALLTVAGMLKYYPFLGLACLVRAPRRRFLRVAGASALVGAVYFALTWRDVLLVLKGIDRGTFVSYGISVGWMAAREAGAARGAVIAIAAASVLLLAGVVLLAARAWRVVPAQATVQAAHLDGFRLGAAIYAGTFLLGNNWDYRLMFTLFCVPQLAEWARGMAGVAGAPARGIARLTLAALLLSLWMQFLFRLAPLLPGGGYTMLALDEAANWVLLGGLAYLLAGTMPSWQVPGCAVEIVPGTQRAHLGTPGSKN